MNNGRCVLVNLVDGTDIRMIQCRGSLCLTPKTGESLVITSDPFRQELERHKTVETRILSFVDHSHGAATKLRDDAVVRNGLADEGIVNCSVSGHGEVPFPPSPLAGIVGLESDEVNEEGSKDELTNQCDCLTQISGHVLVDAILVNVNSVKRAGWGKCGAAEMPLRPDLSERFLDRFRVADSSLRSMSVMGMLQQLSRFPIWAMRETALSSKSIRRPVSFSCNAVLARGNDLYIAPQALKQS